MRKIIAENMHASQRWQLTLHASLMTSLISYRNMMKDSGQEEFAKISYNDMILFAVAKRFRHFPS